MSDREELAEEVSRFSRLAYQRGLVGGAGGNVSARLADGKRILITPSGISLRDVTPDCLIAVDLDGNKLDGPKEWKASKETGLHMAIYRECADARAVIHVHPPYATAFTCRPESIPMCTVSAELKLRDVPLVSTAAPGSPELRENVVSALRGAAPYIHSLLLERHGLLAFAEKLTDAFDIAELVEDTAKIAHLSERTQA